MKLEKKITIFFFYNNKWKKTKRKDLTFQNIKSGVVTLHVPLTIITIV